MPHQFWASLPCVCCVCCACLLVCVLNLSPSGFKVRFFRSTAPRHRVKCISFPMAPRRARRREKKGGSDPPRVTAFFVFCLVCLCCLFGLVSFWVDSFGDFSRLFLGELSLPRARNGVRELTCKQSQLYCLLLEALTPRLG